VAQSLLLLPAPGAELSPGHAEWCNDIRDCVMTRQAALSRGAVIRGGLAPAAFFA
jgi:hypothetical protein